MIPEIRSQVLANSQLTLQLNLKNVSQETLLFRPTLEDWIIDNEITISSVSTLDSSFICLFPQQTIKPTLTVEIPASLQPGQILSNWLRFPGVQEIAIPLLLTIISQSSKDKNSKKFSLSLSIELPIIEKDYNSEIDPIFSLMSGIIDLDNIPSRWLIAELGVKLCQIGDKYSQSTQGKQLLNQLKSTDFFLNGITDFSSAKIPEWIRETIKNIHQTLPCEVGESSLLYIWERWLFSLDETHHTVPKFLADDCISQMGFSSEKWFSNIILGLAKLSPKIEKRLLKIQPSNNPHLTPKEVDINLSSILSALDLIPVRWLAIEILVKIAYLGETSLQIDEEKKLCSRLSASPFFTKGILGFSSAQIPRWIDISYSAISAYYHSLGVPTDNHGLLAVAEEWLWKLTPNSSETRPKSQAIDLDIFTKELGMSEERWFNAIIFGLKQLSPRIAETLKTIAQTTEHSTNERTFLTSNTQDIIKESGSIQR